MKTINLTSSQDFSTQRRHLRVIASVVSQSWSQGSHQVVSVQCQAEQTDNNTLWSTHLSEERFLLKKKCNFHNLVILESKSKLYTCGAPGSSDHKWLLIKWYSLAFTPQTDSDNIQGWSLTIFRKFGFWFLLVLIGIKIPPADCLLVPSCIKWILEQLSDIAYKLWSLPIFISSISHFQKADIIHNCHKQQHIIQPLIDLKMSFDGGRFTHHQQPVRLGLTRRPEVCWILLSRSQHFNSLCGLVLDLNYYQSHSSDLDIQLFKFSCG